MFKARLEKLRTDMEKKGFDGVFLIGDANRNYMSGFTGDESFSLITKDKAFFITDSRFTEQARMQVKDYECMEYSKNCSIYEFVADLAKENDLGKIGFEENIMSFSTYSQYKNKMECEFVPLNGLVEEIRIIKDQFEIEQIRKAQAIADKAFEHMLDFIKPGMTEREIGLELEFAMKKMGATALSFPSIIASGVRSSLPHGQATDKVVENGDFLTLDFGAVYNGYCSDMTRTIVIGKPTDKMVEIYNVVLEAEERALKAMKPGARCIDMDAVARDYIKEKGYGEYFGHSLGHGVGREIHEAPSVGYKNESKLKAGMVVTDEPGIYVPNFGGVRIEDLVLITEDGCEAISKSPKNLISI